MTSFDIPAHFTAQQRAFLQAALRTKAHLFLKATAGAGKTTTLVSAAHALDTSGVYFAYNKHAVADLAPRLPSRIKARTLHAHGLLTLHQYSRVPVTLSDDKARSVAALVLGGDLRGAVYPAARAWDLAREANLLVPTADQATLLADAAQWEDSPHDLIKLIPRMHAAGQRLYAQGLVDFTDFLWLPVTYNYAPGSLKLALVDEAQDLTPLRQAFILHLLGLPHGKKAAGRLIFVGDREQAIYTYAGADPQALSRLRDTVGATEWPLSVSFRCPAQVVQYARAHSDFIESAPSAKPGVIEHVAAEGLIFERGQTVLCRTNAPLIRLALELMAQRVSINLVGRDLERHLGEGLDAALPTQGPYRNEDVTALIRAYYDPKAAPLKARMQAGDQAARRALTELQDRCRCLRFLAWVVSRPGGQATLADARRQLSLLCRENHDADVTLSSVHRAKGKEWPHVTILYPELMPLAQGDPEEEQAVQFVAITRSQSTLRFAYGKESWAQQWRVTPAGEAQRPAPSSREHAQREDFLDEPLEDEAQDLPVAEHAPLTRMPLKPLEHSVTWADLRGAQGTPNAAQRPQARQAKPEHHSAPPNMTPPTRPPAVIPHQVDVRPAAPRRPDGPLSLTAVPQAPTSRLDPQLRVPEPPTSNPMKTPRHTPFPATPAEPRATRPQQDSRPFPLLGGPDRLPSPTIKARLLLLTEEERPALVTWAQGGLTLLSQAPVGQVDVHLQHLERFEQAARIARVAVPTYDPPTPSTTQICTFDGPIARIKTVRRKSHDQHSLRLVLGKKELKFDPQTGELSGATDPLSPFVLPEALAKLQRAVR